MTFRVTSLVLAFKVVMHSHPGILSHHCSSILGIQSHSPHLVTWCLLLVHHAPLDLPFHYIWHSLLRSQHVFQSCLLGTLHLAFSCSSHKESPLEAFFLVLQSGLTVTHLWYGLSSHFWRRLRGSLGPQCGFRGILRHPFLLGLEHFLFICWPEWIHVSLTSFWGSPLLFDRVHFIPLIIHTFFSFQCSYSLHSWALPKRGIFVDPHLGLIFLASDCTKWSNLGGPHVDSWLVAVESG